MNAETRRILSLLETPVVLLDPAGRVITANASGEEAFQSLCRLPVSAISLSALHSSESLRTESLIQRCLRSPCPSRLTLEGHLLRLTPLSKGGEAQGLLEWLPDESGPGASLREGESDREGEKNKLRFLQEVSRAVNSSLILEDIFEALGDVLQIHIPFQEAVIVILDDSQNGIKMRVRMFREGDLEISGEHNAFAGYDPLVDRVLREPFPYRFAGHALPKSQLFTRNPAAILVAPLINKGVVIGLIAMADVESNAFQQREEELLAEVSDQLAVAVENAKLYWQTQAQAGREFLINRLTRSIRESLNIDIILGTAVTELAKVIGVSRCFIRYFPPNAPRKVFQYHLPGTKKMPSDQFICEESAFTLRKEQPYNPFILNDIRNCPPQLAREAYFEENDIKSLAIFPILIHDELAGAITLHQCDAYRAWVMEDIELLKAIAEHLSVALRQARLFAELDERKRELEQTLEELQRTQLYLIQSEKMAVLGQFVAGIAHEVNTPLGTMISNNATLQVCIDKLKSLAERVENRQAADSLFSGADRLLSLNKLASTRIQEIVKNLRNFARLDESALKTVDLHEGIESTLLLLESSLDPDIRVIRRYEEGLPPVQCYPGLLNQVFMNLIVNASHALQDIPKQDPARPREIIIETRAIREERQVRITIRDTGKGIPPENLAKVFDPGFTTKGAGVGTGLGLALCYRIVEKHHGHIWLDSAPGHGAVFYVEIPSTQPQSQGA